MSATMKTDQAVSPVIGVMLMIVVTIIIAAIVSAFAGSMGNDEHKAPVAFLDVDPNTACNGTIEFHAKGGTELELDDIAIQMEYNGRTITLSNSDTMTGPVSTGGLSCTTGGTIPYISESGGGSDGYISAGERFVLTADRNDGTNRYLSSGPARWQVPSISRSPTTPMSSTSSLTRPAAKRSRPANSS